MAALMLEDGAPEVTQDDAKSCGEVRAGHPTPDLPIGDKVSEGNPTPLVQFPLRRVCPCFGGDGDFNEAVLGEFAP